ncbi:permease [Streptococcus cuniculipharyngis]|uniref:Permease n=1 Tax=Streptococcus cuniculipharyngis TaxID=1562651 RepID=A0A5C5SD16_9STRE|nr:permease [Streptococcus cuniculipharyngis]TWS98070.1 permease [Streptococcus cuniculipharyngis]
MTILSFLPNSLLQVLTIFMSIMIEALPFIFLGTLLSGFLEVFITPERMSNYLPKHPLGQIMFGLLAAFFFPSCECGIVPIVHKLLEKKLPSHAAIPFMMTAPVINPIVLFATYSAFGYSWTFVILRLVGASLVAFCMGLALVYLIKPDILKDEPPLKKHHHHEAKTVRAKLLFVSRHAIDDFFNTGSYLVGGSLAAAAMQVYLPTTWLRQVTQTPSLAILAMMGLAFTLSLCSEADAFIGASLLGSFGITPVLAFLLFGPLLDLKNLLMMRKVFKPTFIWQFIALSSSLVLLFSLILEVLL